MFILRRWKHPKSRQLSVTLSMKLPVNTDKRLFYLQNSGVIFALSIYMVKRLSLYMSILVVSLVGFSAMALPRFTVEGDAPQNMRDRVATQFLSAYSLLPPIMQIRLEGNVKFDHYTIKLVNMDAHVAAEVNKKGEIAINAKIMDREDLVTRTIIHELSHIYDLLKILPADIKNAMWDCETWKDHYRDSVMPDACELYQNTRTTVSTMPDFLDATGWYQTLNGKGRRLDETTFTFRSPDTYEASNPREMFAVNMEYFLTDNEFQCRRPSIYRYLAHHFNYQPFNWAPCKQKLAFVDAQFDKAENAIRVIDPNRVYQIHYLLAGSGDSIMSAFGHSMIRVVMCAPQRTTMGPECLKDIEYHIVLSFRAFVNSPQINGWGGLTGAYSSRLFFIPFPQIISEYNISELRDLSSYPLALSRDQIRTFLERAVEIHWSYNNRYYFMSNNCAVEVMNLFKGSLDIDSLMNVRTQTPKGVLFELKKKNLISNDVDFKNQDQAKDRGFFFPSYAKSLDQALNVINGLAGSNYTLKKWVNMSPLGRRSLFQSKTFQDPLSRKKWAAGFLFIERFLEKQITQTAYSQFQLGDGKNSEIDQQSKSFVDKILKTLSFDQELTNPSTIVKAGYGIPSTAELNDVQSYLLGIQQRREQNQSAIDSLIKQLIQLYGAEEIQQTRANLDIFAAGMRN